MIIKKTKEIQIAHPNGLCGCGCQYAIKRVETAINGGQRNFTAWVWCADCGEEA